MNRQRCLFLKKGSNAIIIRNSDTAAKIHSVFLPLFSHYISLVLAAHTGQTDLNRLLTVDWFTFSKK